MENKPTVRNIGFLGQGVHRSTEGDGVMTKEYKAWVNMIKRCYSESCHIIQPSYIGCSVDKRWHNFQNFCEDIKHLDGYREWKENTLPRAYALDKDIKVSGNKVYSKEYCIFVTIGDNTRDSSIGNDRAITGKTYIGTNTKTEEDFIFYNISKFARDNSLDQRRISECLNGKKGSYSDWVFKLSTKEIEG